MHCDRFTPAFRVGLSWVKNALSKRRWGVPGLRGGRWTLLGREDFIRASAPFSVPLYLEHIFVCVCVCGKQITEEERGRPAREMSLWWPSELGGGEGREKGRDFKPEGPVL